MKKFKKYSPFVYFMGGLEGGGEAAPESDNETPTEDKNKEQPGIEKDQGQKAVGGAMATLEGLEGAEEMGNSPKLKKKLTEDEAVDIYDNMIDPVRKAVDFFKGKEKLAKSNPKVRKAVEKAFLAAGGSPEAIGPGPVVKPSNVLYQGVQEDKNDDANYRFIIDELNAEDSSNHLNALMQLSRGRHWKRFAKQLDKLDKRKNAAEKAFDQAIA